MTTTWILVCDASRARILAAEHEEQPWATVEEVDHPAGRNRVRDLVADKEGRIRQSGHGRQGSMEPDRDPTDVEAGRFARILAARLERGFDEHRYARLVLVAPPRFLGLLRKELSDPVGRLVTATVARYLTRAGSRELREHLHGRL